MHIPFFPCLLDHPFLRNDNFKIWTSISKVKVICEVKDQSHAVAPTSWSRGITLKRSHKWPLMIYTLYHLPPFDSAQFHCLQLVIINSLRPRQNRRHFADDVFKFNFLNEIVWILLKISLKFVPKVRINNNPALVQIMAWRWPGDKPLSEPMMVSLLTHICVTRPQRVNRTLSMKCRGGQKQDRRWLSKWPPGGHIGFFGFRTLTLLWLWISTSNFSGTILMYMGRSLLIFSNVIFKMAAWRPY